MDVVLSSTDCGLQKPHPLLFSLGVWPLGLSSSEGWFIGDRLDDEVLGALKAGWWAVWYNRPHRQGGGVVSDAEVGSWEEFSALVQRYLN
jgi:FMN phosphatase YigB (HAD superfamily)